MTPAKDSPTPRRAACSPNESRSDDVAHSLHRLWHTIVRGVSRTPELVGLQPQQYWALGAVACAPRRMSELAEMTGTSCANVTAIVDKLVERGLVERVRSEEDRRVVQVVATDLGVKAAAEARRAFSTRVAEVLGPLEPAEQDALLALLRKATGEPDAHPADA